MPNLRVLFDSIALDILQGVVSANTGFRVSDVRI